MRRRRPVLTTAIAVLVLLTAECGVAAALAAAPAPDGARTAHVRGTVTAENGPSWTVATATNRTVTVTLSEQTTFRTTTTPSTAARFPVGSPVRASGAKHGDAVAADRISGPAGG